MYYRFRQLESEQVIYMGEFTHIRNFVTFIRVGCVCNISAKKNIPSVTLPDIVISYHRQTSPQIRARALFQPYTATGKLKAVIIPTSPTGFHCSISACPGPKLQF